MNLLRTITAGIFVIFIIGACHHKLKQGKKIFYYNNTNALTSLDPAFAKNQTVMWPVHQLYNTLVEVNSELIIKPSLAKSWVIDNEGLVYTFILRNDVYFHDAPCFKNGRGRKFTAYDVAYSFTRIVDPLVASPGAWIFNGKVADEQPFKAVNDSVFQLRLQKSYSPILGVLAMQYCSIVPQEAVSYYASNFRSHPVGTGPFKLVNWQEGQALVLAKNPGYFEKDSLGKRLPYIDGIKASFYDSKATEFLLFRQNKISFINDIDPSFKDEVLTKDRQTTHQVEWENDAK